VTELKATNPSSSHTLLSHSESQPWTLTAGELRLATKPYRVLLTTSIHFPFTLMAVQKSFNFTKIRSGSFTGEKLRN